MKISTGETQSTITIAITLIFAGPQHGTGNCFRLFPATGLSSASNVAFIYCATANIDEESKINRVSFIKLYCCIISVLLLEIFFHFKNNL